MSNLQNNAFTTSGRHGGSFSIAAPSRGAHTLVEQTLGVVASESGAYCTVTRRTGSTGGFANCTTVAPRDPRALYRSSPARGFAGSQCIAAVRTTDAPAAWATNRFHAPTTGWCGTTFSVSHIHTGGDTVFSATVGDTARNGFAACRFAGDTLGSLELGAYGPLARMSFDVSGTAAGAGESDGDSLRLSACFNERLESRCRAA